MKKMIILSGLPASGKSTYAEKLLAGNPDTHRRINWDTMRLEIPDYKFSRHAEDELRARSYQLAREYASKDYSIIIDNTNLNPKTAQAWGDLARQLKMEIEAVMFNTPVEECIRRDNLRTGTAQVGRVVIERMALSAGLIEFPNRPIVIVDVDGTLADNTHRLRRKENGKTDWGYFFRPELIENDPLKVSKFTPYPVVADWVRELYKTHTVLIVSGRPENLAAKSTVRWLEKNEISFHHIFMRNAGDNRDDTIIKKEILDKILAKTRKDMIDFCIDDRNRVVAMWRANGLRCVQVITQEEGEF